MTHATTLEAVARLQELLAKATAPFPGGFPSDWEHDRETAADEIINALPALLTALSPTSGEDRG